MGKNNKFKRIIALIGAVLLAVMYLLTLIFAIMDDANTMSFFRASIALTIFVPVFIYANQVACRVIKGRRDDTEDSKSEDG